MENNNPTITTGANMIIHMAEIVQNLDYSGIKPMSTKMYRDDDKGFIFEVNVMTNTEGFKTYIYSVNEREFKLLEIVKKATN